MPLAAGRRLGAYQIVAPLGAGGMGEVYRARDTTLNRDVAIKVLPDLFADAPERLPRLPRSGSRASGGKRRCWARSTIRTSHIFTASRTRAACTRSSWNWWKARIWRN